MTKRLLLFYPANPFTKRHGVHSRFLQLLKYFKSRNIEVDMLSITNRNIESWPDNRDLAIDEKQLLKSLYLSDFAEGMEKDLSIFSRIKRRFGYEYDKFPDHTYSNLKRLLQSILNEKQYDFLFISSVYWGNLIKDLKANTETVLAMEDFMTINLYEKKGRTSSIGNFIDEEVVRINGFDKVICISRDEMQFFDRFCHKPEFHYIPHSLPVNSNSFSDRKTIDVLFIGSKNPFNRDGIKWFFEDVYPLLDSSIKISIIGHVNSYFLGYPRKYPNVKFIEFAEQLEEFYTGTRLTICPMLGGTGQKIKIIESLSFGVPVVATPKAITGLGTLSSNGCESADTASDFANKIMLLIDDDAYREAKSIEGHNFFRENFSEGNIFNNLDKVFLKD